MELVKVRRLSKKSQQQMKQRNFNNRYTITEKAQTYDSFSDPHSSYYFSSHPVRHNLRRLKKALSNQKNSLQKKKLEAFIKQRKQMNTKISSIFKRNSQLYTTQQVSANELLRQTLGSLSLFHQTKLKKVDNNNKSANNFNKFGSLRYKKKHFTEQNYVEVDFSGLVPQNPQMTGKKKKSIKTQEEICNRLAQNLHQKKRVKWLAFLEERKKSIISTKMYPRASSSEKG